MKRTRFATALVITAFLILYSCGQTVSDHQTGMIGIPVEVPSGQRVLHSEFQSEIAKFAAMIASDVAEDGIGSISAAVAVGSDVVWSDGFGWADVENGIPADRNTIYRTGSISKSMTAVVMMQMMEKGYFQLDDPVERYFPEINQLQDRPDDAKPITFRHLSSHTSGLIREPQLEGAAAGPIANWENKIMESIPHTRYQSLPEEKYSYSNIGYGMLGLIVSKAADKPFMDIMTDSFFNPLGMNDSFFILKQEHLGRMSMGYSKRRDGTVNFDFPALEHAGRGYKIPNGGVYSTVGDLAMFAAAMTGTAPVKVFSEESRLEMIRAQTPEDGSQYGLGFFIYEEGDGYQCIGHSGSVAGYNAMMVFDPVSTISVSLLRNYNGGKTNHRTASIELLKKLAAIQQ